MLKSLNIRNFAVIERLEVEFQPGLNLLTGETGSGKSIIVDALGLLLGERSSLTQIRTGEHRAFIEGIFEIDGKRVELIRKVLDELGIGDETEGELIIRREVNSGGKNRVYINDRSVTLSVLRRLQPLLVEIYGQGEQKLLLSTRAQLDLLDAYAGCQALREVVGDAFARWKNTLAALGRLKSELMERERAEDLLKYQLSEIDSIAPQVGEDESLSAERNLMAHAERILQLGDRIYLELYESDSSVLARLANISRQMQEINHIDARLNPALENLGEGIALLSDVADSLRRYIEGINFSPEEFARVDNRVSELERLKRKFGADLGGILEIREDLAGKLERLGDLTEQERRLQDALIKVQHEYKREAAKLTSCRKGASERLALEVENDLSQVAMQNARFIVALETSSEPSFSADDGVESESATGAQTFFSSYGADQVGFLLSANPGESPRLLAQVASGGEMSRLMLTLLTVGMRNQDQRLESETVVFDEIDAGIGGGVAESVGRRLKALSKNNQVLCVTHQPQIARFADAHFAVTKMVEGERTVTSIKYLEHAERIRELARMIAGDQTVSATLETARWMLENAQA